MRLDLEQDDNHTDTKNKTSDALALAFQKALKEKLD
jgi:hypothetical protein